MSELTKALIEARRLYGTEEWFVEYCKYYAELMGEENCEEYLRSLTLRAWASIQSSKFRRRIDGYWSIELTGDLAGEFKGI